MYFLPALLVARVMLIVFVCVVTYDVVVCEQHHRAKHSHIASLLYLSPFESNQGEINNSSNSKYCTLNVKKKIR